MGMYWNKLMTGVGNSVNRRLQYCADELRHRQRQLQIVQHSKSSKVTGRQQQEIVLLRLTKLPLQQLKLLIFLLLRTDSFTSTASLPSVTPVFAACLPILL